jgi:ribose transport system ATP-binding protein
MAGAAPRLSMRGIVVAYGEARALDGAELVVEAGTCHALLGENGAGKSSMLKALLGASPMRAGTIEIDGVPFVPGNLRNAEARGIAVAHQELSLIPHLSVADAIALGASSAVGFVVDRRARDAYAESALRLVDRLDVPLQAQVRSLSAAQRQLVELARAFARARSVLVLDEPTSSLAVDDAERLYSAVDAIVARGVSVVFVSHYLSEVRRVASHATVLRDGRTAHAGALASVHDDELIRHMAGRSVETTAAAPRVSATGAIALRVQSLSSLPHVRDASFAAHRGEILGIAGLAGAGRTELLEAVFGLRHRNAGSVEFAEGADAAGVAAMWRNGVGMVAEDRKLCGLSLAQSIAENVALPNASSARSSWSLRPRDLWRVAEDACASLRVKLRNVRQPVRELSGGNQQKVAFARLLASGAEVLLLDEPTRGIDVGSRGELHALLRRRAAEGACVVVVSSHLPELLAVCDRIAVMRQGRLQPARAVSEWTQESLLSAALHCGLGAEDVA